MKLRTLLLLTSLFITITASAPSTACAYSTIRQDNIVVLDNGDYIETTIKSVPNIKKAAHANSSITKTKTSSYKDKNGNVLWSVSLTGTFTYNGNTSSCTSCYHSSYVHSNAWSIKSVTSSRSGNTATAKAIATHSDNGISHDFTKIISLSCNKNGVVS